MRYFITAWLNEDGADNRARGAFREGCEHMLPKPRRAGVWQLPKPLDLDKLPKRIRVALERDGYYLESLGSRLDEGEPNRSPPDRSRQH
jgi:hypothetical protein